VGNCLQHLQSGIRSIVEQAVEVSGSVDDSHDFDGVVLDAIEDGVILSDREHADTGQQIVTSISNVRNKSHASSIASTSRAAAAGLSAPM